MSKARFETAEKRRRAYARLVAAIEKWMRAVVVNSLLRMEIESLEAESRRLTALIEKERPEYEAAVERLEAMLKEHSEFVVYDVEDTEVVIYIWENTDHRPQIYALTTLAQDMLSNRPNPIPFKTSF